MVTFPTPGVKFPRLLRFWESCDLPLQPRIHPLGELQVNPNIQPNDAAPIVDHPPSSSVAFAILPGRGLAGHPHVDPYLAGES